jgi:hypothetical protein
MNRIAAFLGLLTGVVSAQAPEPSAISYSSVADALASLRANPSAQFETQEGWTVVSSQEGESPVLWSFTPEGHPAHPAVIKRTVVQRDGSIFIDLAALCEGPQEACDQLVEEFKRLNEQIQRNMRGA